MKSQDTNNPSVILDGKFAKWYIEQFAIHKDGQKILDSVSLEAKILRSLLFSRLIRAVGLIATTI